MKRTLLSQLIPLATATFTALTANFSAQAVTFEQQEVNQNQFIAIARPYGGNKYDLLILQQIPGKRQCWQESGNSPIVVDPLLLNFDFTGSCERSTDSNGYSMRVNGQDLGLDYLLRVVERNGELVLMGTSRRNGGSEEIIIGRTHGLSQGFMKFDLDSGWRFAKRAYGGRPLSHVYLTSDRAAMNTAPTQTSYQNLPTNNIQPAATTQTSYQNLPTNNIQPTATTNYRTFPANNIQSAATARNYRTFPPNNVQSATTRNYRTFPPNNVQSDVTATNEPPLPVNNDQSDVTATNAPPLPVDNVQPMPSFNTSSTGKVVKELTFTAANTQTAPTPPRSNQNQVNSNQPLPSVNRNFAPSPAKTMATAPPENSNSYRNSNLLPPPPPPKVPRYSNPSNVNNQVPNLPSPDNAGVNSYRPNTSFSNTSYKVMAAVAGADQQNQVRSLYPDAFATSYNGQRVLQVGVFSTQENAQQAYQSLQNAGLRAIIIP